MAYYNRASIWYYERELSRAVADFNMAIKINPGHALAYANRGLTELVQRRWKEANADFDQCLKLDPSLKPMLEDRIKAIMRQLEAKPK